MVTAGELAQSALLPLTAFAILYLRQRKLNAQLAQAQTSDALLWLASVLVSCVSLFGVVTLLR